MAINKHRPHVCVVPEDDANRQLANGFVLENFVKDNCIEIKPSCGGWSKVLDFFKDVEIQYLREYKLRHLVLLIDFDGKFQHRFQHFKNHFPPDVADRVYVIGTSDEPEGLRKSVGRSLEDIGEQLANDCGHNVDGLWCHDMVIHNHWERLRLMASVKGFLF